MTDNTDKKLFPELETDSDNQIVIFGAILAIGLVLLLSSQILGDDNEISDLAATISDAASDEDLEEDVAAPTTAIAAAAATTLVAEPAGFEPLRPVVSDQPGEITPTRDGDAVVLTGFVANLAESKAAEDAIRGVSDVASVTNRLEILEPPVLLSLETNDVISPEVRGRGTSITVKGIVASEADRAKVIADAGAIDGVEGVNDQLTVNALDVVNNLPQVEFQTGSATIVQTSFANLRQAAEILQGAGLTSIEVQGYTDTVGSASANVALSQARADAVTAFLIESGADAATLTAKGYGPTDQFAAGDTPDALAENRKVILVDTEAEPAAE